MSLPKSGSTSPPKGTAFQARSTTSHCVPAAVAPSQPARSAAMAKMRSGFGRQTGVSSETRTTRGRTVVRAERAGQRLRKVMTAASRPPARAMPQLPARVVQKTEVSPRLVNHSQSM